MDLVLIRHAKAADAECHGSDSDRPLTADGRHAALAVGAALAGHGVAFDHIFASPLVRAVETAELVAVQTRYAGQLGIEHWLEPEARPKEIEAALREGAGERLALVGHEPSIGRLLSRLLDRPGLSLSKGAAVRLTWDPTAVGASKA